MDFRAVQDLPLRPIATMKGGKGILEEEVLGRGINPGLKVSNLLKNKDICLLGDCRE